MSNEISMLYNRSNTTDGFGQTRRHMNNITLVPTALSGLVWQYSIRMVTTVLT